MCVDLYLASDQPLPELPFNPQTPTISVTAVEVPEPGRMFLFQPYTYRLGSYMGCGCGFLRSAAPESADALATEADYRALAKYLRQVIGTHAIEMLCIDWAEYWTDGEPPFVRRQITLGMLEQQRCEFQEGEIFTIIP